MLIEYKRNFKIMPFDIFLWFLFLLSLHILRMDSFSRLFRTILFCLFLFFFCCNFRVFLPLHCTPVLSNCFSFFSCCFSSHLFTRIIRALIFPAPPPNYFDQYHAFLEPTTTSTVYKF